MDDLTRSHRADARENRRRILDAARATFAAQGLDAPLREVARRAGVGPATLYRHFATKEALATEAYRDEMNACQAIVDRGCTHTDPWVGFCLIVEEICELHQRHRGFTAAFMTTFPRALDHDLERQRRHMLAQLSTLADQAQQAGRLRHDFAVSDLLLMLTAHRGVRGGSPAAQTRASRRFAHLTLQAFSAAPQP